MDYLINISDIYKHFEGGKRRFEEGERVANANHIIYMGITDESEEKVKLLSLCCKSTDLFGMPHELNIGIETKDEGKDVTTLCSCIGGSRGDCKHCVASLTYLARNRRRNIEIATCTDVRQKWGNMKQDVKSMYQVVPMASMCHFKPKTTNLKSQVYVDEATKCDVFNMLVKEEQNSLLSTTIKGYGTLNRPRASSDSTDDGMKFIDAEAIRLILESSNHLKVHESQVLISGTEKGVKVELTFAELTADQKKFYLEQVVVNIEAAVNLCLRTKLQNGEVWKKERRIRVTGSPAYKLITPLRNKANLNKEIDWPAKFSSIFNSKFQGNAATAHGIRNEPHARKCYEREYGYSVTRLGSLVHPDAPWLLISLDGIVLGEHTIEIKCPTEGKSQNISGVLDSLPYLKKIADGHYNVKEKHSHYCQMQLGMFVTNLKYCDFIMYASFDDSCHVIRVCYDQKTTEEYIEELQYVYFKHMLQHITQCKSSSQGKDRNHAQSDRVVFANITNDNTIGNA